MPRVGHFGSFVIIFSEPVTFSFLANPLFFSLDPVLPEALSRGYLKGFAREETIHFEIER